MDAAPEPCTRCRHPFTEGATPDANGWCARCRAHVVRSSTRLSLVPAIAVGAGYLWLLSWSGLLGSRFVVAWLALGGGITWLAFKVSRRVAFEVVRARVRRASTRGG